MPEIEKVSSQDRINEITDKLEKGIKELFEGDKFRNYLNTMSKVYGIGTKDLQKYSAAADLDIDIITKIKYSVLKSIICFAKSLSCNLYT